MNPSSILWTRGIRRGAITALRSWEWSTAFGALFGILLLLQLLIIGLFGIQGFEALLQERTDLRLEIQGIAEDQHIREFMIALQEKPFISKAEFVTRQQAYAETEATDPDLVAFIEQFGMENPFPDSIRINLRSLDDYAAFEGFVRGPEWQNVVDPTFLSKVTSQEEQVHALLNFTYASRSLSIVVIIIVGAILIFTITELVRRRLLNRRDEVLIEQLVGAHPMTILLPFATETTLMLWIGIVVSLIVSIAFLFIVPFFIPALGSNGIFGYIGSSVSTTATVFLPLACLIQILLAPVVSGIGSALGMWKQIRSSTISMN